MDMEELRQQPILVHVPVGKGSEHDLHRLAPRGAATESHLTSSGMILDVWTGLWSKCPEDRKKYR